MSYSSFKIGFMLFAAVVGSTENPIPEDLLRIRRASWVFPRSLMTVYHYYFVLSINPERIISLSFRFSPTSLPPFAAGALDNRAKTRYND